MLLTRRCAAFLFTCFASHISVAQGTDDDVQKSTDNRQHSLWKRIGTTCTNCLDLFAASSSYDRVASSGHAHNLAELLLAFNTGAGRWQAAAHLHKARIKHADHNGHTLKTIQLLQAMPLLSPRACVRLASTEPESVLVPYRIACDVKTLFPKPEDREAVALHDEHVGSLDVSTLKSKEGLEDAFADLDLSFPQLKVWHRDPLVLTVENFLSEAECDEYIALSSGDASSIDLLPQKEQCSSTNWNVAYERVPQFLARAAALLNVDNIQHFGPMQLIRYRPGEFFNWHFDASPAHASGPGGNRLVTLLVYLNDMPTGGQTKFQFLRTADNIDSDETLGVSPKKGRALVFFPCRDGEPDLRMLHAGEPVMEGQGEKWIALMFLYTKSLENQLQTVKGSTQANAAPAVHSYAQEHGLRPIDVTASQSEKAKASKTGKKTKKKKTAARGFR